MIKKIAIKFLGLLLLCICVPFLILHNDSSAEEKTQYKSGIYTYEIINEGQKQIAVTEIESDKKKVTIPSTIDGYSVYVLGYESNEYNGYYGMKEIGGGVRDNMTELVIPSSVKYIRPLAFAGCTQLKKVLFPEGITLCYGSFSNCTNWKDITLPKNTICENSALPSGGINTLHISNSIGGECVLYGTVNRLILSDKGDKIYNLSGSWASVKI